MSLVKLAKSKTTRTKRRAATREARAQEMAGETTQVTKTSTSLASARNGTCLRLQQQLLFAWL